MNKKQIKAELRRSACEDESPADGVADDAYPFVSWVGDFLGGEDKASPYEMSVNDCRTFFLLVAEAL